MKVTILIPAFNEEKNIAHTIKGLKIFVLLPENQLDLGIIMSMTAQKMSGKSN